MRRESMRRKRAAAGSLHGLYPSVRLIHLELRFESAAGWTPAALVHALYPPAPAYFRFECPFGDCDGAFDVDTVVAGLIKSGGDDASGSQTCPGSRAAAGQQRQPCGLIAHHRVRVRYSTDKD